MKGNYSFLLNTFILSLEIYLKKVSWKKISKSIDEILHLYGTTSQIKMQLPVWWREYTPFKALFIIERNFLWHINWFFYMAILFSKFWKKRKKVSTFKKHTSRGSFYRYRKKGTNNLFINIFKKAVITVESEMLITRIYTLNCFYRWLANGKQRN